MHDNDILQQDVIVLLMTITQNGWNVDTVVHKTCLFFAIFDDVEKCIKILIQNQSNTSRHWTIEIYQCVVTGQIYDVCKDDILL